MNLRLRDRAAGRKKIEIAALICLADVFGKERPVAPRVFGRRRRLGRLAAGQFRIADV